MITTPRACSILLAVLPCAAPALAQDFTSPSGFLTQEAPSGNLLFALLPLVNQFVQVDRTLVGTARPGIHTLAWRRDGAKVYWSAYGSQTVDVEVRMAHADWSQVQSGVDNVLANLTVDPFITVFQKKAVVLPDWRDMPVTAPAPFDLQLPLDTAWNYDGVHALLWQMQLGLNALSTEYVADFVDEIGWLPAQPVGVGCQVPGMPGPMAAQSDLNLQGAFAQWYFQVVNAPAFAPVFLAVGVQNPTLDIGACTLLYASHEIVDPRGTAFPDGTLSSGRFPYTIRHHSSLIGARVWAQFFALDTSQGPVQFALSRGIEQAYPAVPSAFAGVAFGRDPAAAMTWGWADRLRLDEGKGLITGISNL